MRLIPDGYAISPVEPEDIPYLIAVDKAAAELFIPTGLLSPAALNDHVPADAFNAAMEANHAFVMRTAENHPVGFTLTSLRGNGLYLDQISVDPAFGRQGLGRALMIRVIEDAEDRRLPCVTLSTFRNLDWNGPFYATMGFKEIPQRRLEPFMLDIQEAQKPFMDVSARCFMKRKVRRPLLPRRPSKQEQA